MVRCVNRLWNVDLGLALRIVERKNLELCWTIGAETLQTLPLDLHAPSVLCFFVFFSLFLFLFKLFCHVQQSCFVYRFTVWGLRATWPHHRLHRADWGGLNLLIFLLIFSALLQGNHFSGISGNVEMSGISSMSGKDQEKGPKSGKGQEFCAVGEIWLWQLNKII